MAVSIRTVNSSFKTVTARQMFGEEFLDAQPAPSHLGLYLAHMLTWR